MRLSPARVLVATLASAAFAAGGSLAGCSSSGQPGGEADAADASAPEGGPTTTDAGDGSVPIDATLGDGDVGDSSLDAPPDVPVYDTAPPPYDFGLDASACNLGPRGEPTDLACTGLYSDWASKTVSADLRAYTPGLPFWSDGAQKSRWIYLPPGQKVDTSNMDEWTFPIGTKIWKEFRIPFADAATDTRVETRLLWKLTANLWYRTTYLWSSDGATSATELTTGELDAGGTGYEIPSQIKCNECHVGRIDGVLGFEAVSLAAPSAVGARIDELLEAGVLTDPPDASLTVPGDATQAAALGWLHSNCGTACHNNGNGQAQSTGFWMRLDVATLASVQTTDTYTTGWNQPTAGFPIPGITGTSYRLHACDTAASCVYYRAGHRDGVDGTAPGSQMPPIDTHVVDAVDLASVAKWIDEGCDAGDGG